MVIIDDKTNPCGIGHGVCERFAAGVISAAKQRLQ